MKTRILRVAAGLCALAAISHDTAAETVYVDQRYGPGGTGTSSAPHNTIQAAINNANSTVVIVYPGVYSERLSVTKSLKIIGYDGPNTTKVEGSAGGDTVTVQPGYDVWIAGLNISSGRYGVHLQTSGYLHLRDCVVCGNSSHGIYLARTAIANSPNVWVHNCVVVANGGSAVYLQHADGGHYYDHNTYPAVEIYNSILISNTRYGVESSATGFDSGPVTLDYNDSANNGLGAYSGVFGSGNPISTGSHSISLAPEFVGGSAYACNQDFRLLPTSACKDAGHPGIGFLDPDGTRNDIGAYGGPAAQNFYTNPNDGPMIRSVTIDQGMVPRGSSFTIRATGAVR